MKTLGLDPIYLFIAFLPSENMDPTPQFTALQLSPQEVAHIVLKAFDEWKTWESKEMQVLGALLESKLTIQWPQKSLRTQMHGEIDHLAQRALEKHMSQLLQVSPVVSDVAGDGNCLDNSTLFDLFGNWSDAFKWRVMKGLHFIQNAPNYHTALALAKEVIYDDDTAFEDFTRVFFENKTYQSPFHDLPAAHLLRKNIAIWIPKLGEV